MEGSSHTQAGRVSTKELRESARSPEWIARLGHMAASNANTAQPPFNAPWQMAMCKKTSRLRGAIAFTGIPFSPLPLTSIKGEEGNRHKGWRTEHLHSGDLGSVPSPDQFVTPTINTPSARTRQLDTGCRVLLLGGPNQSKSWHLSR
jgi:hypothetical protein